MTQVAPFRLRLLGAPSLIDREGQPVRLRTKKQLALLARLAWDAPRGLSRDFLVDLLWPDAGARAARHSLAQALTALRGALGADSLIASGGTVGVRVGLVAVDLRGSDLAANVPPGRLFDGFEIPDSPGFEQWRDQLDAETWPVVREALVRAIDRAKSIARYDEVEALGRELLDRDPLCEAGIEACLQGRALAGDRIGALQFFDDYVARLDRELGASPSDRLARAAANLRRGVAPRDPRQLRVAEEASGRRSAFKPVPLIGRETAYGELRGCWLSAQREEPQRVVIVGVHGVGKTSLGLMLAGAAHAEGAAVVRVQAHETERTSPYGLLAEVIRQMLAYPGAGATPGEALAELSRICAAVRVQFPGVAEAPPAVPETVHLRLTEGLLALLDGLTEEQPVLVLVDDAPLVDDASLGVMQRVARKLGDRRVLLCYIAPDQDLTPLLSERGEEGRVAEPPHWQRLLLGPLEEAAARALVGARLADVAPEVRHEVEDRAVRQARGNPLALEMLLLDWRAHGARSLLFALDALAGVEVDPSRIPDRIQQAFERQRARLSETAREVLDLAAVLGHRLLDLEVYGALGASPLRVAEASRQLLAAGLWSDAGAELEFRNELLRMHAYLSIPRQTRVALHGRVAAVLTARLSPPDARQHLELAWHLWRADQRGRSATEALEGAELCLRTFAPRTAERVAMDFLAEAVGEVERSRFRYVLGRALAMQSRLRAAEGPLRDASADGLLSQPERIEARLRLADVLMKGQNAARIEEALHLIQPTVREAELMGNLGLTAKGYRMLTQALMDTGRETELDQTLQGLLAIAQRLDGKHAQVELSLAFMNAHMGRSEEALAQLQSAIALFRDEGNVEELAYSYNGLGVTLHRCGRWSESRQAFLEANRLYLLLEDYERHALTLKNVAAADLITGNYDAAIPRLQEALEVMEPAEHARYQAHVRTNLLACAIATRNFGLAESTIRSFLSDIDEGTHWEVKLAAALAEADYHIAAGRLRSAWPLIRTASSLAAGREQRISDLDQFVRLEILYFVHNEGLSLARARLAQLYSTAAASRASTALLVDVLQAWLDIKQGVADRCALHAALDRVVAADAVGIVDELTWSGFTVAVAESSERPRG